MKNAIFSLTLFLLFVSVLKADENQFEKAEKLYRAGEYDKAIKEFESILSENEISSSVFYNIGNCYYKKSDYTKAILYYEKAAKYNPSDEDILYNLQITRLRLTDEVNSNESGVSGWFFAVVNTRGADYWTWLTVLMSIAGTLFLFLMFFSTKISFKRISLATAFAAFAFSIVFYFFSSYQIAHFNADDEAVIISENAEARSEPDAASKPVFIVPAGMKVKILSEKEGWYEVILNSNVGWLKHEELEKI